VICPECDRYLLSSGKEIIDHLINCGFSLLAIRERFVPLGVLTEEDLKIYQKEKGSKTLFL
jgi:hypothetical protein